MEKPYSIPIPILLLLLLISPPSAALNFGLEQTSSDDEMAFTVSRECSRTCESKYCAVPPLLRYGKYCGLLYSGCPGEEPCDGLDDCCKTHDACVGSKNNDYLNVDCNQNFLNCINDFKKSGQPTFHGNTCSVPVVVDVISVIIEAAIVAGKIVH
ncbi:Phospholipase A(2) [Zostera marina]|uniref:phospholipase A2 n=1 Tax=Zostera marina TaxID=29655 RepID=A0A0K9Q324_ZOSMR|nr:Phospholipase A(2) [Zostera marina]